MKNKDSFRRKTNESCSTEDILTNSSRSDILRISSRVLLKHGKRKADPSYFIESPAMSESSISKRALERRQKREREREER